MNWRLSALFLFSMLHLILTETSLNVTMLKCNIIIKITFYWRIGLALQSFVTTIAVISMKFQPFKSLIRKLINRESYYEYACCINEWQTRIFRINCLEVREKAEKNVHCLKNIHSQRISELFLCTATSQSSQCTRNPEYQLSHLKRNWQNGNSK